MQTRPVAIQLQVHLDGDSPTGRARSDDGEREFAGWIGLVAAIEHLLTAPPPPSPTDGRRPLPNHDGRSA